MPKRVLLIEDDLAVLNMTAKMLSVLGYDVEPCSEGSVGLGAFISAPKDFDLVLMDYSLKDCGAADVIRVIKNNRYDLPLVVMSGHDARDINIKGVDSGKIAYIQKPFSKWDLQNLISNVK